MGSLLKEYYSSLRLQVDLTIHIHDPRVTRFLKEFKKNETFKIFPELEFLVFRVSFQFRIFEEVREITWK